MKHTSLKLRLLCVAVALVTCFCIIGCANNSAKPADESKTDTVAEQSADKSADEKVTADDKADAKADEKAAADDKKAAEADEKAAADDKAAAKADEKDAAKDKAADKSNSESSDNDKTADKATDTTADDAKSAKPSDEASDKTEEVVEVATETVAEPSADEADVNVAQAVSGWGADMDCAACHDNATHDGIGEVHEALGLTCLNCHTDTDKLETVHEGVDASSKQPKRLKRTEITEETCLTSGCHGSREELIAATDGKAVVTDKNGKAVNSHAIDMTVEEHATLDCGSCHEGHKDKDALAQAEKRCFGCHHEEVLECNTCHSV